MKTETYAGRKISIRALKGDHWGYMTSTINGHQVTRQFGSDEAKALDQMKATIDQIDLFIADEGIDGGRWEAKWLAPGTFELGTCGHPRDIGGVCRHGWCVKHRCQWDMPDSEQPDSIQCRDTAMNDRLFCEPHADLNHSIAIAADAAPGR